MPDLIHQNSIKPDQIIETVLRFKWLIISLLSIALTVGLVRTLTANRTYEASTLILVQPQKVPRNFVRSIVSTGIQARISTISQQIMSRSNLEKIIDQFGLYQDKEDMYLEDKIENLRNRINVNISRAGHGSEAFTIKFRGGNPDRVMRIANTLASYFMDENLKVREAQAVGTSEFLSSELEKTRKKLKIREKRLSEYRAKYLGGLPDELESNLRTLDRLQTQHTDKLAALRDAKKNLNALQNQFVKQKEMTSQSFDNMFEDTSFTEAEDQGVPTEDERKIDVLEKNLEILLLKYTEKHPDVIDIKNSIQKLEEKMAEKEKQVQNRKVPAEGMNASPTEKLPEPLTEEDGFGIDFMAMQQENQLKLAEAEIARIQSDIKAIEGKMAVYQERVEQTPKREQELQELKRDYGNIREVYTSLLNRKLEAEVAVNMEKKQKGEQFRILDHARKPEKPISPDVKKMFVIHIASGTGIAGGIIFVFFVFDSAVRRDEDLVESLNLPIFAEIATIKHSADKVKDKIKALLFTGACAYTVLIVGVFLFITYQGIDRTIDMINSYVNF